MKLESVSSYNLFGEHVGLPDIVHIETIETRSLWHNWTFAPHRHSRLHQILVIEQGSAEARLEDRTEKLTAMQMVNIPGGVIHGYVFEEGTKGWVLTIAAEVLDDILAASGQLKSVLSAASIVSAPASLLPKFEHLSLEFSGRTFGRAQALRSLTGLVLTDVARAMAVSDTLKSTQPDPRFTAFMQMLELHFAEGWTVSDYAQKLGMTPVHLTRICRTASGKPTSKLIDERLMHEARRNLVYTNLSISKIGYMLGFQDPAYFSRVFTRTTGYSPREFRANSQSDQG